MILLSEAVGIESVGDCEKADGWDNAVGMLSVRLGGVMRYDGTENGGEATNGARSQTIPQLLLGGSGELAGQNVRSRTTP
jgi:hypothetical protein